MGAGWIEGQSEHPHRFLTLAQDKEVALWCSYEFAECLFGHCRTGGRKLAEQAVDVADACLAEFFDLCKDWFLCMHQNSVLEGRLLCGLPRSRLLVMSSEA